MMRSPNKSSSFPDISSAAPEDATPPNYINTRNKRKKIADDNTSQDRDAIMMDLRNEMKDLMNKTNKILTTLQDIQQTNNVMQTTLANLTEENTELKTKISKLEFQSKQDSDRLCLLENILEGIQRIDKKTNIEIKNVPLKGNENKTDLIQIVAKLCDSIEVNMEKSEIKDIIKTKKPTQERSTLIVEFTNTSVKTDIIKATKSYNYKNKSNKLSAKHLGLKTYPDTPIFVAENLTAQASRLYFLARDFKQVNNYKYCWTNYGKVYLRFNDDSPIVNITKEAQLQQLANR